MVVQSTMFVSIDGSHFWLDFAKNHYTGSAFFSATQRHGISSSIRLCLWPLTMEVVSVVLRPRPSEEISATLRAGEQLEPLPVPSRQPWF